MMPDVTGMDVYERLAARGGGLERRIVFLSGGAVTERAQSLLASAPNLRFEKPVDPKRIELLLQSAVERTGGGT
jgi:CheY-like chemotaxis protein